MPNPSWMVIFLLASPLILAAGNLPVARVWEAPLVIPTYLLGPPDPNPALLERAGSRPIYPYPMLDSLTNVRQEKTYKAVYLENEYLKVTVLPEIGGHLYAIFDKTANRDVLYTNHVLKYGLVGIRGAWVSGGIEWNFPDGHSVTTVSPIDYATRTESDGSASVTVGDTERVQRMQWAVTIRLRPGRKVVETEVTLNNRRNVPGRYWFWATGAAHATDDLRFVYPMREAYPHAYWPIFSFPIEKGVDVSTYRGVTNPLSLFARNSKRDFMGVYYEKSDWGVVHVADHREVPGKKTWTWGTDDAGTIWIDKLTDKDGQYVEFQAGRYETQMEHEFLAPHRVEHFIENWYPVNGLGGGFSEATVDAALRVTRQGSQMQVAANVNASFDDAELKVEAEGQTIATRRANLNPANAFHAVFDLPASVDGKPIAVWLADKTGRELIRYRTDTPVDGNPEFRPATRPVPDPTVPGSAEQAYVQGVGADKKSNEPAARAAYLEALQRDPGFAPAHIALGLSFYRSGEYDKAADHLTAALLRNREDGDAHYYLGLTRRAQHEYSAAADELLWAVRSGYRESAARYVLGEMALELAKPREALEHLSQAVLLDPRDLKARTLLAMAERLAGNLDEAQKNIDAVVRQIPIDYLALSEQHLINKARGNDVEAARAHQELWRVLDREPDSVLELAFDYAAAGRIGETIDVLDEAVRPSRTYPMLYYALGYFCGMRKDDSRAASSYQLGAKGDTAYVFPHRVEEIAILRAALEKNPQDGRAFYYLGNALASKLRTAEALDAWRAAVRLDPANGVAHRNLALALGKDGEKEEAVAEYQRAIQAAPGDFHLYLELARLLPAGRAVSLFEQAPVDARSHPAVHQALAAALVDAGRFADAAALLDKTQFVSGEGERGALQIFREAHLGLARQHQQAGQHAQAAAEFLRATEYPRNLGVGRPGMESQAREYVAAARELEAAGRGQEADSLWRRAAEEPLNSPTEPREPWSANYYFKAFALDHIHHSQQAHALYTRLAALYDDREMLAAEPDPPQGAIRYLLAGMGLKALGQTAQARAALERALAMDPRNELAKTALGDLSKP
jgi:tetratricopeptide (TPR) repeat protein